MQSRECAPPLLPAGAGGAPELDDELEDEEEDEELLELENVLSVATLMAVVLAETLLAAS